MALSQRKAAAEATLGQTALGVLNLAAQAPITPSEAAKELHVPPQSITRAVKELTDDGLIQRRGHTGDGRSYSVELTTSGDEARKRFREQLSADFARHLHGWSDEEVDTFADQLTRLSASLAEDRSNESARERRPNPWRKVR